MRIAGARSSPAPPAKLDGQSATLGGVTFDVVESNRTGKAAMTPAACIVLAATAVLLSACISDPDAARLDRYQVQKGAIPPAQLASVFVSSEFFRGHRRHPGMSRVLEDEVSERLRELGFRVAAAPSGADYRLATELRGWWAPSARFALMTLITLTAYTPLDYKWILDVELSDGSGETIGSAHERGAFRFETFGIVFFPPTIIGYYSLVPPHWREIAHASSNVAADYIVSEFARVGATPPRPVVRARDALER
jgi:hypothetical protein